ncbi:MAG: glycosyltransferase family 39 protein [Candidatus Zixiibacteriota bacterium]
MTASNSSPRYLLDLWLLWGAALILRIIYFVLAIRDVGLISACQYSPDSTFYQSIADSFLSGQWHASTSLLKVGPGYGMMLAAVKAIFGPGLIAPVALNILLGSLAPVLIYLIAQSLFENRLVSLVAGAISAVSLTSVALSSQILTDQPFFTIHAAAILAFTNGIRTARFQWFLAAGALGAWGAYVRSAGEPWLYLFAALILLAPRPPTFCSRRHFVRTASVTVLIMLLMVASWSWRNRQVHGLYTFGTNGVMSLRSYLLPLAVGSHTPGSNMSQLGLTWSIEDGDNSLPPKEAYGLARQRVIRVLREHPGWMFDAYFAALKDNIRNINIFLYQQIPSLRWFTILEDRVMVTWLGYLIVAASFIGLVIMIARRQYLAAMLLGTTYAYFTFIAGFSFSQGSRLHYPAEMAWSILTAYFVVSTFRGIARLIRRSRSANQY